MALGQNATCTITNDDQAAHLKLVKSVVNDNGGTAQAADFTLSADGPTPISGAGMAEGDVNAGSYALSETSVAGYTAGAWSCEGGSLEGATVTVALGQNATCTITNDDQAAHLKLVKSVVNDNGGTAQAGDFTLSADGPTPISGAGVAEGDVNAGSYALSETSVAGYTAGAWSCEGGSLEGATLTVALGQKRDVHDHQRRPGRPFEAGEVGRQRQRRDSPGDGLHVVGGRADADLGRRGGRRRRERRVLCPVRDERGRLHGGGVVL